jgi:hypothetical protein
MIESPGDEIPGAPHNPGCQTFFALIRIISFVVLVLHIF